MDNIIQISNKKIIIWVVAIALAAAFFFLAFTCFSQQQEIKKARQQLEAQKTNERIVIFLDLFVEKVLKTDKEITFENRLKLENAVRDINDPEILSRWEAFVAGTTEVQIQQGVKDLLEVLVNKMIY
jgi:cell division protein FtsL